MDLEINNLKFSFGEKQILRDVELAKISSKIVALIGPSGGGKSTLLRILAGLLRPDSGGVLLDQTAIPSDEKALRAYRKQMGVVFQIWNLFYHLTALENVVLPLVQVHGVNPSDAEAKALELLTRFELQEHAKKHPYQLSGGQQQRVAIVRAIAIKPRCLLLDEPTSALDPEMAVQVLQMIEEIASQGTPVFLVTHQLSFARRISDDVLFLSQGKILEHAPTHRFFAHPEHKCCEKFLNTVLNLTP